MVDFAPATDLYNQANQASSKYSSMLQQGTGLSDMLRQAVNERFSNPAYDQERQKAQQTVLTSDTNARQGVMDKINSGIILSPTQQQSMIASQKAADITPLMNLNITDRLYTGGAENAIQQGLNAYQMQLQAQANEANRLGSQANTVWDQLFKQAQLEEEQRQFNEKQGASGLTDNAINQLLLGYLTEGNSQPGIDNQGNLNWSEDQWNQFGLGDGGQPQSESQTTQQNQPNFLTSIWNLITGKSNNDWANSQLKL
jgi:hypothetical protein